MNETFRRFDTTEECARDLDHGDRLAAFRDYLYERLGMVKYRAKGWIK